MPNTISSYISSFPKETQKKLKEMRDCIKKSAPGATESIKWSMPSFSYKRILVIYGGFKNHIGLYPTTSPIKKFAKEISRYKNAKGSIQFPIDKPLPLGLITKITKFRVKESREEDSPAKNFYHRYKKGGK